MLNPLQALVTTEWLALHLDDPDLRIVDATVKWGSDTKSPKGYESGRADFEQAHIPGAQFADLLDEFSASDSEFDFTLPDASRFAGAMSNLGISNRDRVVVYSASGVIWATRIWWMLRAFGFDNAAVLDGGFNKWQREGRKVSKQPSAPEQSDFKANYRPNWFVDSQYVLAAMSSGASKSRIIDVLTPEMYSGEICPYSRPGHIKGAVNLPFYEVLDAETGEFLPLDKIKEKLSGVLSSEPVQTILYCGGGIAATGTAFALLNLGLENVSVYDGSMQEWSKDESLPME